MGHPLRMYEPDVVYEVTVRAIQGRRLLRPSPEANEIIAGVYGRAQALYPSVRLYGLFVLSTHITELLASPTPADIPAFIGYINGNLSHELGDLYDWPGTMWDRRQRPLAITDDDALVQRLEYLLAQGTKEGLVASPRHWPGVSCVDALRGKRPLRGTWFDRDSATKARRRGHDPGPYDYATAYTVDFDKIPCWAQLSDADYAARIEAMLRVIERDAKAARGGRPVLGVKAILAEHPHSRPEELARSPAPLCHASTRERRLAFRARYHAFVAAFRSAAAALRDGVLDVVFPPWSFPPPRRFVTSSA